MKKLIVAIDGPAGSGKSTSAKLTAKALDYLYIDTGAMYRACTFMALKQGIIDDEQAVIDLARSMDLQLKFENGVTRVFVDGDEITDEIRTKEVNANVSPVSTIKEVRAAMVAKQRDMGKDGGVVMEGRDIGTAVFPQAEVKIFLIASITERAKRRLKEYREKGNTEITLEEVEQNLAERDRIDSTRAADPLTKADDAYEVDTSDVTIEQQVERILQRVREVAETN